MVVYSVTVAFFLVILSFERVITLLMLGRGGMNMYITKYPSIFTFLKQAFNESLDFCNRS